MSPPADGPEPALIFGKYQVIRRLMVGGMGEIFLARQTGTAGFDRLVILKTLLPELAEQPGSIDQFLDEARVAAMLNHPNIVAIYEVGAWQGVHIIAMEFIRGENLGKLMEAVVRAGDRMPARIAAKIVHDAALALDHAHHASDVEGRPLGIVHRDIGMQNIMVRTDGVTKVVDFGIARAANRAARTATGMVKGKLPYMSPEQLRGESLDGRSDQFSLGVVLWELLTHQRLFKAENEFLTMQKLLSEPIRRPSELDPRIDPGLEAVLMRMLERDRAARFPRLRDAAAMLDEYLSSLSGEASERQVSEFVVVHIANAVAEKMRDLTPSQESFAAGFTPLARAAAGAARTSRRRAAALWIGGGLLALTSLAAAALWAVSRGDTAARPPPIAVTPDPIALPPPMPEAVPPARDIEAPPALKRRVSPQKREPAPGPAKPAPATTDGGFLTLNTRPWVKVTIDGKPYGSTPLYRVMLPPGRHQLELVNEAAGVEAKREVEIEPGANKKLTFELGE